MTRNYSVPVILQGKVRTTKALQAKEKWYVEFYFEGHRHRKSDGLNRIKDYQKKINAFTELRIHYEALLVNGKFNTVEPAQIKIPSCQMQ